jgi:hypothetical protein
MSNTERKMCEFDESIVSYLYGELPVAESERFEDHLLDCIACADEFASFASSRYEVYESAKEFAKIPTPVFVIPSRESVSLGERVRRIFVTHWGWSTAGAAFASIAIAVGLGYYALQPTGSDIAAVAPLPEEIVTVTREGEVRSAEIETTAPAATAERQPVISKVKIGPPNLKQAGTPRSRVIPQQTRLAASRRQTLSSPRLTEFADDSDDSLRLAELFDDVGSSE